MGFILKILGGLSLSALALAGLVLADFGLNDGRVIYALMGRDALVAACRPALAASLAEKGFTPTDIEFEPRPSLDIAFGKAKELRSSFTFTDGVGGSRVDGTLACVREGTAVRVRVDTTSLPRRAA